MKEQIKLPETGKYGELIEFFKNVDIFNPEHIARIQENGSQTEREELQRAQQEATEIISALEAGNTGPAKLKLLSMIGENARVLELDERFKDDPETPHMNNELKTDVYLNLRKLTGYLSRSEGVFQETADSGDGVSPKGSSTERIESGEEQIRSSLEQIKKLEDQLKQALSEIQKLREGYEESLRQIELERMKRSILG